MIEILEWLIYNICGRQELDNFRMRWRSFYPLTIWQRITFPLFAIRMLNHFETPTQSKPDIIEKFIVPYMNGDKQVIEKYNTGYMCFHRNEFVGIFSCNEEDLYIDNYIEEHNIKKWNVSRETFFFVMPYMRHYIFNGSDIPYYEPKLTLESFYRIRIE